MKFFINIINHASPPHKHTNYEIIAYFGTGVFRSSGGNIPVTSGNFIIVPPGIEHGSNDNNEFERIYIRGEFNQIFNLTSPTLILDNSENEGMMLAKMIYNHRYSSTEYLGALTSALAHFLSQNLKMDDEISIAVRKIVDDISNNFYDSGLNLCKMLKNGGYAEDYIRAKFKKITGKTPIEFLTRVRIGHACYLIDTYKGTLSLSEIAEKCGYTDYVYFSRRFKQIIGMSPRKYMTENS